jgi:hypothetical protein
MKRKVTLNVEVRKMRILLLLSCIITTAAALSGQIGYPSARSNFDERKVGTCQLPDLLTTSGGMRIADAQAWYKIRRPEIDRLLEEQEYGVSPVRIAIRSPWQNGIAERFVGSCRRDQLDHVIVANKRHLKRLMSEYVRYYNEYRTHLGLAKETPARRAAVATANSNSRVVSMLRLGGLHHRYDHAA